MSALEAPFEVYEAQVKAERMTIWVAHPKVPVAEAYFAQHPLVLADGTLVSVEVHGRYGDNWFVEPEGGPAFHPTPVPEADLLGVQVREAARRANAAGWLVRAYEPEAILTLDHVFCRINLCYSADRRVTQVHVG